MNGEVVTMWGFQAVGPRRPIRSFEIRPAGANHFVAVIGTRPVTEPVELQDAHSRIRFALDFASERGWTVSATPPGGIGVYEIERNQP